MYQFCYFFRHFPRSDTCAHFNENSSNEKRLAALGSRGRGPPRSGGRAWSFRLLDFHKNTTRGKVSFRKKADFSTFTMSNTPLKCIMLIIRYMHFGDLLDCPLFAIKPPFHPKSSRCPFSECLYTKHFPKHALLDLLRSLMPRGKVNRFRGKTRHFPRGWKWRVRPEGSVEPVPRHAAGESEPFSQEFPALSPEEGLVYSWKVLEI